MKKAERASVTVPLKPGVLVASRPMLAWRKTSRYFCLALTGCQGVVRNRRLRGEHQPAEPDPARTGGGIRRVTDALFPEDQFKGGALMRATISFLSGRAFAAAAAIVMLSSVPVSAADKTLTIYTYESFISEWGPGPKVKEAFEKTCECKVDFVGVADGVALLTRLKLEGDTSKADIILGLDTNLVAEAKQTGFFDVHGVDTSAVKVPGGFSDDAFIPYDYGHFPPLSRHAGAPVFPRRA
jgi:ABC-type thiamine transport system, periplasmic component